MNLQAIFVGVARHVLTLAGGWLVAKGHIDADTANQLIGGIVGIVGVALSIHDKAKVSQPAHVAVANDNPPVIEAVAIQEPVFPSNKYPQ